MSTPYAAFMEPHVVTPYGKGVLVKTDLHSSMAEVMLSWGGRLQIQQPKIHFRPVDGDTEMGNAEAGANNSGMPQGMTLNKGPSLKRGREEFAAGSSSSESLCSSGDESCSAAPSNKRVR